MQEIYQRKIEETQGRMAEVLKNTRETTRLLNESLSQSRALQIQTAALQKQIAEMMRKIDEKDKVIYDLRKKVQRYKQNN